MPRFFLPLLLAGTLLSGCIPLGNLALDDHERIDEINDNFTTGDFETVVTSTNQYLDEYPRSYTAWCLLGWAHLKMDEDARALECFDKSLELNSEWDNAYVGKGAIFRKQEEFDRARECYLKAISILPDNAEAYSSLQVIELMESNDQKAVEYGEKAWALRKDYPSIPANLSVVYHYMGNTEKRDEFYGHAKRLGYYNLEGLQDIYEGRVSLR